MAQHNDAHAQYICEIRIICVPKQYPIEHFTSVHKISPNREFTIYGCTSESYVHRSHNTVRNHSDSEQYMLGVCTRTA